MFPRRGVNRAYARTDLGLLLDSVACIKMTNGTNKRAHKCLQLMSQNVHHLSEDKEEELLKWVGHVSRMPMNCLQRRMMTCWVENPRPNGLPKQRWGHAVNRALKAREISTQFTEWFELAQNEESWNDLIGPLIRKEKKLNFKKLYKERVHTKTHTHT